VKGSGLLGQIELTTAKRCRSWREHQSCLYGLPSVRFNSSRFRETYHFEVFIIAQFCQAHHVLARRFCLRNGRRFERLSFQFNPSPAPVQCNGVMSQRRCKTRSHFNPWISRWPLGVASLCEAFVVNSTDPLLNVMLRLYPVTVDFVVW
jgi:hypothetical protein